MDRWWWYLSRSTGIVATALAVGALVFGLFFSARNTGGRRAAAWWLDLHNYLGGLALVATGAHVLAVLLDPRSGIGIVQVIVPGTARAATWAVTWGVLASYLLAVTVVTSWPKKRMRRRVWRAVHLTSVGAVALAGLHTFQLGSDGTSLAVEAGLLACSALAIYAVSLRLIGVVARTIERRIHT